MRDKRKIDIIQKKIAGISMFSEAILIEIFFDSITRESHRDKYRSIFRSIQFEKLRKPCIFKENIIGHIALTPSFQGSNPCSPARMRVFLEKGELFFCSKFCPLNKAAGSRGTPL